MSTVIHDQKNARHRTWGSSYWGGCGAHIPGHGVRGVTQLSPSLLDAYFPLKTDGGLNRFRLFSGARFQIARDRSSRLLEHRRRAQGFSLPLAHGSVATLCRCRLARGPQCCLLKHGACKLVNASKGHNQNVLSTSQFQRPNRDTKEGPKSWKTQPIRTAQ